VKSKDQLKTKFFESIE
jgi:hypothetical protein